MEMTPGKTVATVLGPISVAQLGSTLMHEHIFVLDCEYMLNYPAREGFDEERHVAAAVNQLNELKKSGIDSIVDVTVFGLGRDVRRIRRVAEATGVSIIVATGVYFYDSLPLPFRWRGPGTPRGGPEPLIDMFVGDIVDGIAGTGVRAGVIKCVTDKAGLTPDVERALRAAARTHVATGAPITTHADAARRAGLDQLRIFQEEGVDPSRIIIGHCDDTFDVDYLAELLAAGVTLGLDHLGSCDPTTPEHRVELVAELCRRGFSSQLVLSVDTAVFNDSFVPEDVEFSHVPRQVLPALRERGVTDSMIHDMLLENPARLLAER